jgi:hypothetical protein
MEDNVSSTFGLGTTNVTMEVWANPASASVHGAFIKIGGTSPNQGYALGVGVSDFDAAGNNFLLLYEGARWIPTGHTFGTGWHHAVMVIDGSGHPIAYLDGVQVYTDTTGIPLVPQSSITHIGGYTSSTPTSRHFQGILDEIRISNSARSADWIATEYKNQSNPATFYGMGAGTATPIITSLSTNSGPVGTSVTITGNNFGTQQGTSTVTFNGTAAAAASSWSNTSITVTVPTGATSGNVVVTVNGLASNGVNFTVSAAAPRKGQTIVGALLPPGGVEDHPGA